MRIRKIALSDRGIYEPVLSEEDVIGQIREVLELNGAHVSRIVERIPWGKRTSEAGIPDLCCWFKPVRMIELSQQPLALPISAYKHFFIEVKRPGGKRRPAQEKWIADARKDGVIAFFADSVESMVKGFGEFGIKING